MSRVRPPRHHTAPAEIVADWPGSRVILECRPEIDHACALHSKRIGIPRTTVDGGKLRGWTVEGGGWRVERPLSRPSVLYPAPSLNARICRTHAAPRRSGA